MSAFNINIFENAGPSGFPSSFPGSDFFASGNFNDRYSPGTDFANFTGSDCGDPHLSDSYTTQSGVTGSQKWNSMTGTSDLLSGSQFGGFQYGTGVTTPDKNGVTFNDEFNARFGNGSTIDMNTSGAPEIDINGTAQQMQAGQSYQIDGSTSATWDGNKLTISQSRGSSSLTTTVADNGGHLDIDCSGHGDRLSGALTGNQSPVDPVPFQPLHHHHHHYDGDGGSDPSQNSQWQSDISNLEALISNLESLMQQGEGGADTFPGPLPQTAAVPT